MLGLLALCGGMPATAAECADDSDASPGGVGAVDDSAPLSITGPLVSIGTGGKLVYQPYDPRGDVIPDFSHCGYRGGGVTMPRVPTRAMLDPSADAGRDDTARIQDAIDAVATLPVDRAGFHGALLLNPGSYRIHGTLLLRTGGVVLRGSGGGEHGTTLVATGNAVRPLIEVRGASGVVASGKAVAIAESYVPVGAHTFKVAEGSSFAPGDTVLVRRRGNAAWIHELKMDQLIDRPGTKQWTPFNLDADRVVTAVEGNTLTTDAPNVCAIDSRWGGGEVLHVSDAGRIQEVGVEDLRADSAFDPAVTSVVGVAKGTSPYFADEKHATDAVVFENCKNCWAQRIVATHFINGVAKMTRSAKWITVQDSQASEPVSIITGGRRYPFDIEGQLDLVLRCDSKGGRHAFVNNGSHAPGPAAFVLCTSEENHADSGPHQRWSCGTLWDDVTGVMHTQDRQDMGTGHGWAGANDVYWNCRGSIAIEQPETAENFAFGFVGTKDQPAFPQLHHPIGYYESFGTPMVPASLYLQQLSDRLGPAAVAAVAPDADR